MQGIAEPTNAPAYQHADERARAELLAGRGAVISTLFARNHGLGVGTR
nr:hypothetical protein [Kibdelosporangium sp. MJ126-NF4]CEL13408.1 hypothetical protein [Kibdelosporangium sp. MJ126-NF4]CTQ99097.1 hypothetical protein [Kibdelosporangium sp. MJ126-NF4]